MSRALLLRCRCTGPSRWGNRVPEDLGTWCGRNADSEDGQCTRCREHCGPDGARVLTVEELIRRDGATR